MIFTFMYICNYSTFPHRCLIDTSNLFSQTCFSRSLYTLSKWHHHWHRCSIYPPPNCHNYSPGLLVHFSRPPLPLHSAPATGRLEAHIRCRALLCLLAFAFVILFAIFSCDGLLFHPSVLMFPFLHLVYLLGSTYCYLKWSCWHILCHLQAEFKTSQRRNRILHYWRPSR